MSVEAVRAVAALAFSVSFTERLLLNVLAQEADSRGYVLSARASHTWLARQCGWKKNESVRRTAKKLAERGLLETMTPGRKNNPTTYRLPFVRPATT